MPRLLAAAALVLLLPSVSRAQDWPAAPVTLFGDRLIVGGEAAVTIGSEDLGYFNYTDYERNALQIIRLALTAAFRAGNRVTLVTELRAEGNNDGEHWSASPYAWYVRVRPWPDRAFDLQAGRIPPVFGTAARRVYAGDQVLIGYPLMLQYLTSIRPDAVPASADDLARQRAYGAYTWYPVGRHAWTHGVPIMSAFRYDTGVEARIGSDTSRAALAVSVTSGTLSNPLIEDDNGSPQVAARLAVRPAVGLVIGGSASNGRFLADSVEPALPESSRGRRYAQRAWGADAEYSRDYWLVRGELVQSRWNLPPGVPPAIDRPLEARAWFVEGRYRVRPGLTAALRYDRLTFNRIRGSAGWFEWDAPVRRVEAGGSYALTRQIIVKASVQWNDRDAGRVRNATLAGGQLLLWF